MKQVIAHCVVCKGPQTHTLLPEGPVCNRCAAARGYEVPTDPYVVEGFLVEWENWRGFRRDIFFINNIIANEVAERVRLNGDRVWMSREKCVNGKLAR